MVEISIKGRVDFSLAKRSDKEKTEPLLIVDEEIVSRRRIILSAAASWVSTIIRSTIWHMSEEEAGARLGGGLLSVTVYFV